MGFRLHPAAQFSETELLAAFRQCDAGESKTRQIARLEALVRLDTNLAEALDALASAQRKVDVLRQVGVSERTLERVIKRATGKNPLFWKNLARARRTARQLNGQQPFAELAADSGYADQAHMIREFRKWFGVTPGQFMGNTELTALVQASGYE
ncbi:helix-turn-helix domain-containing protein [Natronospirillum operosum]|nr:helix-turn-helix transcriptional regulator [Natronospirillum operosum]